ncbi:MAG: hypothetical protein DI498_11845 [Paracoccus denitrificans]|nr:MAG: hypothetical protein DI498_11845 [Paracoccus denitrificans]PZO83432.1 MAG: hypothetical protein DI633_11845 [Paracoccus denitrificans]
MMITAALSALTTSVDIYCERTSPAFWAEPVNAVTNLSFVAASIWGARTARARGERSSAVWLLIVMAAVIGVGSFLFHTFAQVWSSFADTIPIWFFVALACAICTVRLGGVRPGRVAIGALVLIAIAAVLIASGDGSGGRSSGPPRLNGSLQYAPAVVALAIFTLIAFVRGHPLRLWVAGALVVFLISLTARTFDHAICAAFPLGLHWIWHLMNGLLLGIVLQIVIRAGTPSQTLVGHPPRP